MNTELDKNQREAVNMAARIKEWSNRPEVALLIERRNELERGPKKKIFRKSKNRLSPEERAHVAQWGKVLGELSACL